MAPGNFVELTRSNGTTFLPKKYPLKVGFYLNGGPCAIIRLFLETHPYGAACGCAKLLPAILSNQRVLTAQPSTQKNTRSRRVFI